MSITNTMLSRYVVSQVKHNSYFLVGLVLGLWVSLAVIPLDEEPTVACPSPVVAEPAADEYEPHREERPLGSAGQTGGRSVQRPRYYSSELGMRASLLTGVLSSEEALKSQIAALNQTTALLQPALKFFITASAMSSVPGLANVVGFTDTREMLKPFHALKYLADNYLEEYDFFFLVTDTTFVNARRLTELVSRLSVSEDVYMGMVAEDDSHYCSLEGGVLLSNSVLRALHAELDWCVRNSYSPHHHENVGRCVLHAARTPCRERLQGEAYVSVRAGQEGPGAGSAVTVRGASSARQVLGLHARAARRGLQAARGAVRALRVALWAGARRLPPAQRRATWPGGLRADPALPEPTPATRFDHLRWVTFNATHALFPDDSREVALLTGAHRDALDLVLREAGAWARARWGTVGLELLEGAWRWAPARGLRYRLLLRPHGGGSLRLVEVLRALGGARLVPARYVTESARLWLVLPLAGRGGDEAGAALRRYESVGLARDANTALTLVLLGEHEPAPLLQALAALRARHPHAALELLRAPLAADSAEPEGQQGQRAAAAALAAALPHLPPDALVLLLPPHAEYNQDFLNRVRMNTIQGQQWYLPLPFARYSVYAHPRFVAPGGGKPATNTGRFAAGAPLALSFYRADYLAATARRGPDPPPAEALTRAPLRCVRAPEPALVLPPRAPPCPRPAPRACPRRALAAPAPALQLGARHSLAQLLLEHEADRTR